METPGSLTYQDLLAIPADLLRHELIGGEHFMSPAPKTRHQLILMRLSAAFFNYLRKHGGGVVFPAPLDVLFSNRDVVEPDLVVVLDYQREIITEVNIQGVPALLAEIVSDSRYDRLQKRRLYEQYGVPQYWIVDPDADRVEIFRLNDGTYGRPEILEPGDTLTFAPLPRLEISVTELLAPDR